jgi:hypothetical protein
LQRHNGGDRLPVQVLSGGNENMEQSHLIKDDHMPKAIMACPAPKKVLISPLGWSIAARLLWAAVASALLWLSVAWAIGWL